ncbi:hypothetical protein BCF46_3230 [Litoreibacter meonggei]|uniref:Polysaccharide chain length determinant protein (PEP-CTERM system associated) n=1 Tax=Litoreibacter meonggei TaxID=1049199 RepID=A0A497VGT3_9RHOB|nr:hypothetical protein BCF46_3230 [Litoreibacter meonggei]
MFDWRYWRWEIIRNVPLAVVVALLIVTFGWMGLNILPPKYTASARVVLERQIGMVSTSKVQRSSEEMQHLQVVVHTLKAAMNDIDPKAKLAEIDENFDLKVESSRDKPTYLFVQSTMPSPAAAIGLANSLATRAMAMSDATQQAEIDRSLTKLRTVLAGNLNRLNLVRETLSAHLSEAPTTEIDDLRARASQLRAELLKISADTPVQSPALKKLYSELSAARGLYSDLHPKIRLIRTRIARSERQSLVGQPIEGLQKQLHDLEAQVIAGRVFQEKSHQLEQEVGTANTATKRAQDKLSSAERLSESNRMQLKVVQDAALTGRSQEEIRAWLLAAVTLASLLAAIGAVALRIRLDRHLRHPRDLHRALGLTPFATIPDLGPSLG